MSNNELKRQFSSLMHELIIINRGIFKRGDYSNLTALCDQDITILDIMGDTEYITAREISNRLKVPKSTIVTAVARLVKRGYIKREQNQEDRRKMLLKLTDLGIKANDEHQEYENIILETLVNMWNEEDQKKLSQLFKRRKEI